MLPSFLPFLSIQKDHFILSFAILLSPFRSVMRITAVGAIFAKPVATVPVGARYFGSLHFSISHAKVPLGLLPFAFAPFPFSPALRLFSNAVLENL